MSRRTFVASIAAVVLLVTLTAGAALAARPVFVFQTVMTGAAEVPGPGDSDAIGHATVMIRPADDSVCWVLSWNRIDGTVVAAHIHGPATDAQFAPPIVTFFQGVPHGGTDTDRGCTTSAAWADAIAADPGLFYVNVHSAPDFGPGAIRGQLR
jgi:hypothetical protein